MTTDENQVLSGSLAKPTRLNKLFLNGLIAARGGLPDDFVRQDFTRAVERHADLKAWMDASCGPQPDLLVYEQVGDVLSDWIKESESRTEALRKVAKAVRGDRDLRWSKRERMAIRNGKQAGPVLPSDLQDLGIEGAAS